MYIKSRDQQSLDRAYFNKRIHRLYKKGSIHFYAVPSTPRWLLTTFLQLAEMTYEASFNEDDFKYWLDTAKSLYVTVASDPDKSFPELTREALEQVKADVHPEDEDYQCVHILHHKDDLPEIEDCDDSFKIVCELFQEDSIQHSMAYCPTGKNTVYMLITSV
ncbi:hypothetical protein [Marinospirillum perlucidum]|uniref:hypothetical protein n=1 Tax=Marinospirillum perlucidum TaxID=1982602 RepID=UPI000DF2DFBC|nr:hypothetical protein [Marinospirillum perlucidum]